MGLRGGVDGCERIFRLMGCVERVCGLMGCVDRGY